MGPEEAEAATDEAVTAARSITSTDPLVQVGSLHSDRSGLTVPGADFGVRRQAQQVVPDGFDDLVEIGVRTTGRARASSEQRVAGEHGPQFRDVQADRTG